MKLVQMASYLDQGLPEPIREALAQLQQDAPPMAPELAASVVVAELGAPPTELFAEWDPVPIAAASIGQVHRAMTHDGRAVHVRITAEGRRVGRRAQKRVNAEVEALAAALPEGDRQELRRLAAGIVAGD